MRLKAFRILAAAALCAACSGQHEATVCREPAGACPPGSDCVSSCVCASGDRNACETACTEFPSSTDDDRGLLDAVNSARASGGICGADRFAPAAPLSRHVLLGSASVAHARDMAAHDYFSHDGQDGSTALARVRRSGFDGCAVGENLAQGQITSTEVVSDWIASESHCRNLLSSDFSLAGIGVSQSTTSGLYWVLDFGG